MARDDDDVLQFGRLNTAGIEKFREKVGLDWPYTRWTAWNEEATLDGIRHYAYGFGDDNPLWCDPEYASTTRWGGIVAPPGYLEGAGLTPKLAPVADPKGRGRGGLSGVHMYWAGDHTRYFRQVRHGDRIWVRRFYVDITEKTSSRFAGRSAVSVRRRVYWNQDGELIAVWDADFVHAERHSSGSSGNGSSGNGSSGNGSSGNGSPDARPPVEPHHYTDEELDEVDAHYAAEAIRGSETRYVEDVEVGDDLGTRYRGPLVIGDIIAWLMGNGRHEIFPYRLNWKNRQRMGGFYSKNELGAWDSAMRVHWDDDYAQSVGAPRAYDYGMLRNAWLMQTVTDWMGDDALLVAVDDRIKGFNTIGDLSCLRAQVSDIDRTGEWPEVVVDVSCTNQRDEVSAYGSIRVRLPSRELGMPSFPEAPEDEGLLAGMPEALEGPWAR